MGFTARTATITPAGGAGVATGIARIGVPPCELAGISVDFSAGTPASVHINVMNVLGLESRSLFLRENDNSDFKMAIPSANVFDKTATELALPGPVLVSGVIVIYVTESDPGEDVTVTLLLKV